VALQSSFSAYFNREEQLSLITSLAT